MALVVVLLFLGRERSPSPAAGPPVASAAGPANVDLSSMTPREAADRLFNRVMENVSTGDSAQARAFAPMALAAYDRVTDIDLDGLYHVAVLQLVNGEPEASLETTERIREEAPDHLFALYTAAQAHELLGDGAEAARMYEHFLASYEAEVQLERPEYSDHAPLLPMMRQEAESRAG